MSNLGNELEHLISEFVEVAESRAAAARPKSTKKEKKRPNPLFVNPLSPLSRDLSSGFPSELHDCIIDHLHDDRHTLATCSLVCIAWHASSTYHLFQNASTIRVHRQNFQRFCQLLASQRLNTYIGRLNLESHIIDESFDGVPDDTFQFNDHLACFTGLPNVKYLRLDYHHDYLLPGFFAGLAENFSGVTDLELSSIHFESFTQFLHVHASLPLLHRLALVAVIFFHEDRDVSPALYTAPSRLIDVVVDCSRIFPALRWLPSNPCIRRLAIGRLRQPAHFTLYTAALRALGPNLEHLIIYDPSNTDMPDLSPATALRTLQITGIRCAPPFSSADLAWIPTLLSQLKSRVLERIVLVVQLPDRAGLDLLDWPRLAALEYVQLLEFSLSSHKKWAMKEIDERLRPRGYVLRVGQWERGYEYGLGVFDR
ncbi:hypothetical protein FB451DRAFT_1556564 [Mycena latifolia]|nr:hypothetical protein FB451DRAFT_1556564 [Mycena latifolia]